MNSEDLGKKDQDWDQNDLVERITAALDSYGIEFVAACVVDAIEGYWSDDETETRAMQHLRISSHIVRIAVSLRFPGIDAMNENNGMG